MNEALELLYYMFKKACDFIFGAYIFEGVSIGMLFVVAFVFTILLSNLLKSPVLGKGVRDVSGKETTVISPDGKSVSVQRYTRRV